MTDILCDENIKTKLDYKKWALKNHPDKSDNPNSVQRFSEISVLANKHLSGVPLNCDENPSDEFKFFPNPDLSAKLSRAECFRNVENWTKIQRNHRFDKPSFDPVQFRKELPNCSPKLYDLITHIRELDSLDLENEGKLYKHFIFSDVKKGGYGAKIIASGLVAHGFNHCFDSKLNVEIPKKHPKNETFGVLSSTAIYNTTFTQKHVRKILKLYNSRETNILGDDIRFIILDSGFKEGVDLFDVKYVHIFENQKNDADLIQAVGRATRSCGQKGLNFIPNKGWALQVYQYYLTYENSIPVFNDYLAYAGINFNKYIISSSIEKMAILSAVDHDLNAEINKYKKQNVLELTLGGQKNNIGCSTNDKCGKKSTKSVPFSLNIMIHAANILNLKLPNFKNVPTLEKRLFFCSLLQNNNEFCQLVNEIFYTSGNKKICKKTKKGWNCKTVPDSYQLQKKSDLFLVDVNYEPTDSNDFDQNDINDINVLDIKSKDRNIDDMPFAEFMQYINKTYKKYKYKPIKIENLCNTPSNDDKFVTFTESQNFITQYFTPNHFAKGLLIWHSVGTGKTCTAISVKSFLFEKMNYSVLWVTRNTLKEDIWKNMYDKICDHIIKEKYKPGDEPNHLKKYLSNRFLPPMSYKQFTNCLEGKNEYYNLLVKLNGSQDILRNTLIIIDEAHKLYSKDLIGIEKPNMNIVEQKLNESKSCKLLLMTGTPIADDPMELIQLLNLTIKDNNKKLPTSLDAFSKQFLVNNKFTPSGKIKFQQSIKGLISYLNRRFDPRQFTQPTFHFRPVQFSQYSQTIESCNNNFNEALESCKSRVPNTQYNIIKSKIADLQSDLINLKNDLDDAKALKDKSLVANIKEHIKNIKSSLSSLKKENKEYIHSFNKSQKDCTKLAKSSRKSCKNIVTKNSMYYQNTMFKNC